MNEVDRKLDFIKGILKEFNIAGIHLRGVDWFSWITGGGSSVVIMTSEIGIAEVFITLNGAWVLTNSIESTRLKSEEVPKQFTITEFPWQDQHAYSRLIQELVNSGKISSDRPSAGEIPLPEALQIYKMKMQAQEIERYRIVGQRAAEAMTEAMAKAQPEWSENKLAGEGAKALWSRGLEPTLILVAGSERSQLYRHPISKERKLNESAMMVFCARGFGLYANLTRFVFFRDLLADEKKKFSSLLQIESQVLSASRPGFTLGDLYSKLENAYRENSYADEINHHHQGGPTGYLSREFIAAPKLENKKNMRSDLVLQAGMALAWNPSLPGAKIEDTVIVHEGGLEVITQDSKWPVINFNGLNRPDVWVRK